MTNVVILAGGSISNVNNTDNKYIIAVDKGLEYAINNNLDVDMVIGDFDSIHKRYKEEIDKYSHKTYDKDKDMSDLELAYNYCLDNNMFSIEVYGSTGDRLDHTFSNFQLIKTYKKKGLNITLIDDKNIINYIEEKKEFKNIMQNISFLASDEESIITVSGVKWPLNKHNIKYGDTLTISNKIIDKAVVKIIKGGVFVIQSND